MKTIRAAQYLRMSTEHQNYSIEGQGLANALHAATRGYEIGRTFADEGVSGLTFRKRAGLQDLLQTVIGGEADFEVILVYDVSRWGRFQDVDEAAHYEFVCRSAGVRIEYTAEPFANDGSLVTSLVKHMKRCMAAEYSRELSDKVSKAQRGYGAKGFWQGGPPGVGYRRLSLQKSGAPREVLEAGEWKGLAGGRVSLSPGPAEEVRLIRRIFRLRLQGLSLQAIADLLNRGPHASPRGGRWSGSTVRAILRNEKYVGVKVTGRTRSRLGQTVRLPGREWIRTPGAFAPLVSQRTFRAVQRIRDERRGPTFSDAQMLDGLRTLLQEQGRLSFEIIRKDPRTPYPTTYIARFGSLSQIYARLGFEPNRQQRLAAQRIREISPHRARAAWREDDAGG